ncbi:TadE/TadG family type IV pilus assembly protein [Cereibacter sediminicola]|uniref:TadE/TadG family type IV pilus assembly protein n=1 Tax=Cereibacter sediminicola TaxID=2584941 RepID=UPI00119DB98F|nr:TadE family protein [Cereibacter sediminicola]
MGKGKSCAWRAVLSRLRRDEGSATIEFVLMLPMFMALLMLITDASLLYMRQSSLLNISRDTARIVSRHAMTAVEAEAYAAGIGSTAKSRVEARVSVADGFVTVTLTADAASLTPFGIVAFAVGEKLSVTATNIMEPV